jgi:hypothetical protein
MRENKSTYINGEECKTKESLFKTFAEDLNFEDYFSNNWDSFEEIINDLYFETENQQIFITNYNHLLEKDTENLEIFESILIDSNKNNDYQFYKVVKI